MCLEGAGFGFTIPHDYLWDGSYHNHFSKTEFVQMFDVMTYHFPRGFARFSNNYPKVLLPTLPSSTEYTYQVFPHRQAVGWFSYVDAYVTKQQIPEAAEIYHLHAGGSLILSTHQYLSAYNEEHIITANKIEIRLYHLGLLPPDSLYGKVPTIPLGVSDGRTSPSRPQDNITVER